MIRRSTRTTMRLLSLTSTPSASIVPRVVAEPRRPTPGKERTMADLLDMPRLSINERDQRWARVRAAMAERDFACLIAPPHTGHWELFQADTRYLTHIGGNCSETACVFPLDGEVTAVVLNRPEFWARAQDWVGDLRTPQHHMWSLPMTDRMKELGIDRHRVGVLGMAISPGFWGSVATNLIHPS